MILHNICIEKTVYIQNIECSVMMIQKQKSVIVFIL